jgi:hypothetical protein
VSTKSPDNPQDLAAVWRDWATIWQSECAAMAQDREITESLANAAQLWSIMAGAMGEAAVQGGGDGRQAGTGTSPGAAAAAAAPDAGGDATGSLEVARLEARVAELERRLDELAAAVPPRRKQTPAKR